jgi:thioredoxin-like negative regulator of GroEL
VVSKIHSEGKNTKSPIIFLHQAEDELAAKNAVESGASAALSRPVEERALRETIESLLDKYILTRTMADERSQDHQNATMSGVEKAQEMLERGDLEGAEAAFEEAMMTGGGSPDVFCGLAEVYLARGDKEAAEQVLGEAERIDPSAREKFDGRNLALLREGKDLLSKGQIEEAEDKFNQALVKGGEFAEVYAGLAEVLLRKNDKGGAERALAEADKLDPGVRERLKQLESTLVAQGDEKYKDGELEEAKGAYKCAIIANEKSVAGNVGLG